MSGVPIHGIPPGTDIGALIDARRKREAAEEYAQLTREIEGVRWAKVQALASVVSLAISIVALAVAIVALAVSIGGR